MTFPASYNNLQDNVGNCLHCDSLWKNQQKTHKILEALFGQKFQEEVYLASIIEEVGIDPKYDEYRDIMDVFRMRMDDYAILNIKDQNGNYIKLAIESQGPQHYRNERGFKTFLFLNRFKGVGGDLEWKHFRAEWIISLQRDELKQLAFQNNKENGYYLITVDNKLSESERISHILDELFEQAGVDLNHLSKNVNIN